MPVHPAYSEPSVRSAISRSERSTGIAVDNFDGLTPRRELCRTSQIDCNRRPTIALLRLGEKDSRDRAVEACCVLLISGGMHWKLRLNELGVFSRCPFLSYVIENQHRKNVRGSVAGRDEHINAGYKQSISRG